MIKIMLVDDHKLIREGIRQLIEFNDDMEVVSEYSNGSECLANIDNDDVDIILLDINMPEINGLELLSSIRKKRNSVKVLMLTVHNEVEYIVKATNLGVNGYILKDAGFEELKNAIYAVYKGELYIQPKLIPYLNSYLIRKDRDTEIIKTLTNREIEVLKLVAVGDSNRDVANALGISERTIKNHISNIFKKIDVNDRTQAAVFAIKNNLISI